MTCQQITKAVATCGFGENGDIKPAQRKSEEEK